MDQKVKSLRTNRQKTHADADGGYEGGFRHFLHPPIRRQYPPKKCGFRHFNPPIRQQIWDSASAIHVRVILFDHIRHPHPDSAH
uniref:Uncharacterized protein n=1 Tax=Romanomermis culicivorax TaxID=13658 RepID=A0A915I423_ROMCU